MLPISEILKYTIKTFQKFLSLFEEFIKALDTYEHIEISSL